LRRNGAQSSGNDSHSRRNATYFNSDTRSSPKVCHGSLNGFHLAKYLDAATKRGEDMVPPEDASPFYDALASNDSAVQEMDKAKLKVIAAELITQVKKSLTIDWTLRESVRAKIKVMMKRILNKHGYPPDLQEEAVKTVLAQAE
jgi:type I restriction enzyme R subunit